MPIIETDRPSAVQTSAAQEAVQVRILSEKTTEVNIAVQTDTAGYVLLADTFYPGWQAFVDGRAVPVQRANGAQRAVFVEPGKHQVRFRYAPASIRIGAVISGATSILCLGVWLARSRQR
jgi:uncharacterized membrane protein YfhO